MDFIFWLFTIQQHKSLNRKQLKKIFYFQWLICLHRFVLCLLIKQHGVSPAAAKSDICLFPQNVSHNMWMALYTSAQMESTILVLGRIFQFKNCIRFKLQVHACMIKCSKILLWWPKFQSQSRLSFYSSHNFSNKTKTLSKP